MKLLHAITHCLVLLLALVPLTLTTTACGGTAASLAAADEGLIVIRRSESEDPKTIDPHKAGDTISSRTCGMVYESLLEYDYLARPAVLVPCLAVAVPDYDAATMSYTFKLRDDVYFQDDRCFHPDATSYEDEGEGVQEQRAKGRKVTARDFVWSFKRLSAIPDAYGFWIIKGMVAGIDDFNKRAMDLYAKDKEAWADHLNNAVVPGLEAPDDQTFRVSFSQPYPQFLYAITMSYGAVMAREAHYYYGKEIARKPVGTGPYVLKRWRFNLEMVMDRSPTYRDVRFPTSDKPEHDRFKQLMGKRLPIADRVHIRFIKEPQPAFLEFLQGNLDLSGISKDQFSTAITAQNSLTPDLMDKGVRLDISEDPYLSYISLNMDDPEIGVSAGEKGRALRRALCLCFDRQDYIRRYLNGRGTPAGQLVPSTAFGYDPQGDMPSQRYEPALARKVLEEAGFRMESAGGNQYRAINPDTGKQARVTVLLRRNDSQAADYAVFLKTCGARVGIAIDVEMMTFNEWLKRTDDRTGQSFDSGWIMDYPDAQNMLQLLYGPNTNQGLNSSGYRSAAFDELYRELMTLYESDPVQRARKAELIKQMHIELERDVPWVVLHWHKPYTLSHQWYTLPDPNPYAYTYIKYVYSDTARRGELATSWSHTPVLPGFLLSLLVLVPAGMLLTRVVRQAR